MDYPKFIVSNKKEVSISIQRVNLYLQRICQMVFDMLSAEWELAVGEVSLYSEKRG